MSDFIPPDHGLSREIELNDYLDALCLPQRFSILKFLIPFRDGLKLQYLADCMNIRPSVCSHHLNILYRVGLVHKQIVSGNALYTANRPLYENVCLQLLQIVPPELSSFKDTSDDKDS